MKECLLCDKAGALIVNEKGRGICFFCLNEIKRFEVLAPFPF